MTETVGSETLKSLGQVNVGLRFLFDANQAQTSALLLLQWCVARDVIEYLKQEEAEDAFLLVRVFNPKGKETRYLFDLKSPQEIIQFYSPGVHKIHGRIFWGIDEKKLRHEVLSEDYSSNGHNPGLKPRPVKSFVKTYPKLKTFGMARISIDVPSEFFAPQLSSHEAAWVNFWFSTAARDSCTINQRRLLAYTVQPIVLLCYVLFQGAFRLVIALTFGVLGAMRCNWSPIIHPFEENLRDVWHDKGNNTSWLIRDKKGYSRRLGRWNLFFLPGAHILLAVGIAALAVNSTGPFVSRFLILYITVILFVGFVTALILLFLFCVGGGLTLVDKLAEHLAKSAKKSQFEKIFCDVSPTQGLRQQSFTPRLAYQAVKARLCQPVAR